MGPESDVGLQPRGMGDRGYLGGIGGFLLGFDMAGVGARVVWRGVARAWWSVGAPGVVCAGERGPLYFAKGFAMLTVSEDAKAHLATIINENDVPEDYAIRLVAGAQGIGLSPDQPKEVDDTYEHDGRTVLVVEPALNKQLDGRTLSVETSEAGPRLNIA